MLNIYTHYISTLYIYSLYAQDMYVNDTKAQPNVNMTKLNNDRTKLTDITAKNTSVT